MIATKTPARRKTANKPARPVTAVLLELAYQLHATKVVGVREVPAPTRGSHSR